jgi:hypothetical protein
MENPCVTLMVVSTMPFFPLKEILPVTLTRICTEFGEFEGFEKNWQDRKYGSHRLSALGDRLYHTLTLPAADCRLPKAARGNQSSGLPITTLPRLLEKLRKPSADRLQQMRAIETIEHMQTSEADKLLRDLAGGASAARQPERLEIRWNGGKAGRQSRTDFNPFEPERIKIRSRSGVSGQGPGIRGQVTFFFHLQLLICNC